MENATKNHVLCLIDNTQELQNLESILSRWEYPAVFACLPDESLDLLATNPAIRIIILAKNMAGSSGIDLCRKIRSLESESRSSRKYIFMMASVEETTDFDDLFEAGSDDFLQSPVDRIELKAKLITADRIILLEDSLAKRIDDLDNAILQVKRLQGLLPICSYCKQIRDDDDHWYPLEMYISQHSEAEFTHSICPACLKSHFE